MEDEISIQSINTEVLFPNSQFKQTIQFITFGFLLQSTAVAVDCTLVTRVSRNFFYAEFPVLWIYLNKTCILIGVSSDGGRRQSKALPTTIGRRIEGEAS